MRSYCETKLAVAGLLLLAAIGATATAVAQDTLVALGRVESTGVLSSSQNTVGATVGVVDNGTGDFTVTVSATGAFAGASADEFVVELTIAGGGLSDDLAKSSVSVSDDLLSVDVAIVDLEDASNVDEGEVRDRDFFFVIRRAPVGAATVFEGTRYLRALGVIDTDGTLLSGYGLDGISVSGVRDAEGDYTITLTKSNGYATDTLEEHLIMLTPINGNEQDQVMQGTPVSIADNNAVLFRVRSADVQIHNADDTVTAMDNKFGFTIYRLNDTNVGGVPDSQFLTALANIQGSDGSADLAVGAQSGMVVNSTRNSEGDYRITVTALGAFAGMTGDDFVSHVTLRQTGAADEAGNTEVTVFNNDTLHVDVNTNDLEQDTEPQGVAQDADFALALYSIDPIVQPDLRIGTKKALTKHKGDEVINPNGAQQGIRLKLEGRNKERFFFAIENDGNVVDDLRLSEAGAGNILKTKYFNIQGGRTNITATVRTGGEAASDLAPGKFERFEAQTKYRKLLKRPNRKLQITGTSIHSPANADTVKVKVKPEAI